MQNMLRGTTHTYTGQEAVAVGACAALDRDDTSPARTADTATVWPKAATRGG